MRSAGGKLNTGYDAVNHMSFVELPTVAGAVDVLVILRKPPPPPPRLTDVILLIDKSVHK